MAIYDAFFNTTPTQQFLPNGGELEIFLNYTSNEASLGGTQLPDTTIGGQAYHVWSAVKSASTADMDPDRVPTHEHRSHNERVEPGLRPVRQSRDRRRRD